MVPWARTLAARIQGTVVVPEFRGYDTAEGKATCVGVALDARAAREWIRASLLVEDRAVVYFGHSLGAAIACDLAREIPPARLVLAAPFTSARAMAHRVAIPGVTLFWRAVSRVAYDNVARVGALACPVSVVHGDCDAVVPVEMCRQVFAAARVRGALLIVPGASHSDLDRVGGEAYWRWLEAAVRS